jgi:hypothetical protein
VGIVCAGQCSKKLRRPGAAVATIYGEPLIDLQSAIDWKIDEQMLAAHVYKVFIILNATEPVMVSNQVLTDEYFVGPPERRRNDETATPVVKRWQNDRSVCDLFDAGEIRQCTAANFADVDARMAATRSGASPRGCCCRIGDMAPGPDHFRGRAMMSRIGTSRIGTSRTGFVSGVMRGAGEAVAGKEAQDCERQKGRDWGVQTHHDFRRRGTPEQFLD